MKLFNYIVRKKFIHPEGNLPKKVCRMSYILLVGLMIHSCQYCNKKIATKTATQKPTHKKETPKKTNNTPSKTTSTSSNSYSSKSSGSSSIHTPQKNPNNTTPKPNTAPVLPKKKPWDEDMTQSLFYDATRNRVPYIQKAIQKYGVQILDYQVTKNERVYNEYYGKTLMQVAVKNGSKDVVEFLLDCERENGYKVSIDDKIDEYGNTLLHWASIKGNEEMVNMLIAKGSDLNVGNDHGLTPIVVANVNQKEKIVDILKGRECSLPIFSKSADENCVICCKDKDLRQFVVLKNCGHIICKECALKTHYSTCHFCKENMDKGEQESWNDDSFGIVNAVRFGQLEILKKCISSREDVNTKSMSGFPLLKIATIHNDYKAVKILLEAGAWLNKSEDSDFNPLKSAKDEKITNLLKSAGGDKK